MTPLPPAPEARLTRILFAATALALLATALPVAAAPLCRDSKGLFTPCAGGETGVSGFREQRRHSTHRAGKAGRTATAADTSSKADEPADAASDAPKRPAVVSRAHLCRDLKGLYKPC